MMNYDDLSLVKDYHNSSRDGFNWFIIGCDRRLRLQGPYVVWQDVVQSSAIQGRWVLAIRTIDHLGTTMVGMVRTLVVYCWNICFETFHEIIYHITEWFLRMLGR